MIRITNEQTAVNLKDILINRFSNSTVPKELQISIDTVQNSDGSWSLYCYSGYHLVQTINNLGEGAKYLEGYFEGVKQACTTCEDQPSTITLLQASNVSDKGIPSQLSKIAAVNGCVYSNAVVMDQNQKDQSLKDNQSLEEEAKKIENVRR